MLFPALIFIIFPTLWHSGTIGSLSWMSTACSGPCSASRSLCTLFPRHSVCTEPQDCVCVCCSGARVFQQAFGRHPGSGGKWKSVRLCHRVSAHRARVPSTFLHLFNHVWRFIHFFLKLVMKLELKVSVPSSWHVYKKPLYIHSTKTLRSLTSRVVKLQKGLFQLGESFSKCYIWL